MSSQWATIDEPDFVKALEQKCVSCHSNSLALPSKHVLGADCQVCHGPASAWNGEHYSSAWKSLGASRFDNTPMLDIESPATRASICSSCHIGELHSEYGVREVNHELMAAGHPPMHFDFTTYMSRYPRHWNESAQVTDGRSDSKFKVWRIGKLALAVRRVELIIDRARDVEQDIEKQLNTIDATTLGRTWPELTEYSCYSCHHSLQDQSWRHSVGSSGKYDWDAWTTAELALAFGADKQDELQACLTTLRDALESSFPDPTKTKNAATENLQLLNRELENAKASISLDLAANRVVLLNLLDRLPQNPRWESVVPWFIATQVLLADLHVSVDAKIVKRIEKEIGFRSQVGTEMRIEGPIDFDPEIFKEYRLKVLEVIASELP